VAWRRRKESSLLRTEWSVEEQVGRCCRDMRWEEGNVSGTYLSVPKGEGGTLVADPDRGRFRDPGSRKLP
jgi:hypothetical protein